jgi:hypothetical protein
MMMMWVMVADGGYKQRRPVWLVHGDGPGSSAARGAATKMIIVLGSKKS